MVLARNLRQEIATSRRNVVHPVYGGDRLYPQDETLIHEGGRGFLAYDIYTEIAKDCHAYAVLQKRFMAVVGREWEVLPGQRRGSSSTRQEKKAADMLKAQLEGLSVRSEVVEDRETTLTTAGNFDEVCWNLLWAIHYGWQPAELIWDQDGSEAFVSEAIAKDLRRFVMVVGQRGFKLRMLDITGNLIEGVPLPHRKFIVHRFASVPTEDPYGLGLGTRLFYPTFFKRQDIKFWLQFADKFASPTAVAKYPRGSTDADKKEYLAMLDAIATDAGIAIPADVIVEFLESERASALNTYKDLAAFCDSEISKAVLGETGTTDQQGSGGSRARDQVGDGVRIEVAKADADLLSATLNRSLCRWVSELNFGPDVAPPMIWRKFPELAEKEDLNARATRDNTIASASGRTITEKYWVDTYGVEFEPKEPAQDPNAPPDLSGAFGPPPGATPDAPPPPDGATPDATAPPADAAALDAPPALNLEEQLCKPCTVEHSDAAAESSTAWTVGDASNLSEPAETPAVETTTQQLTQSAIAQSQQPVEDWFEKVRGLLEGASSLEEVRDRLYELYKDLPGADFAEAVARAMQVAELAGRWEVLNPEPVVNLSEEPADFAAAQKVKQCKTGYSCGYSCVSKTKNCRAALTGQGKNYADWLSNQIAAGGNLLAHHQTDAQSMGLTPPVVTKAKAKVPKVPPVSLPPKPAIEPAAFGADPSDSWVKKKIDKMKKFGLDEKEAVAIATWIGVESTGGVSNYSLMNKALYAPESISDPALKLGIDNLNAAAISGYAKIPSITNSAVAKLAAAKSASFWPDQDLSRHLSVPDPVAFVEKYRAAIGGEISEPTHFATTHLPQLNWVEGSANITYKIRPRWDGTGQAKYIDNFKNGMSEGEIMYPPGSKFIVKAVVEPEPAPVAPPGGLSGDVLKNVGDAFLLASSGSASNWQVQYKKTHGKAAFTALPDGLQKAKSKKALTSFLNTYASQAAASQKTENRYIIELEEI